MAILVKLQILIFPESFSLKSSLTYLDKSNGVELTTKPVFNQKNPCRLFIYRLNPKLNISQKLKVIRGLYGYKDHSYYGKYTYQRQGLLKNIPYLSPLPAVLIVKEKDASTVLSYLRGKAKVYSWPIILTAGEAKKLRR